MVGITIYDCLYICNTSRRKCTGYFIFIMDLGDYSGTSFLKNKEHLTRLLLSTSPYYSDFMPIYSAITNFLHNDKEQK